MMTSTVGIVRVAISGCLRTKSPARIPTMPLRRDQIHGVERSSALHSLSGSAHLICKLCTTESILGLLHLADSFSPTKRGAIMQQNVNRRVREIIAGHFGVDPKRI